MKWKTVKLGSVTSKVGSGATPRGGDENYQDSGIPLIRSMNVRFEGFKRKGLAFISEEQAAELDNVIVEPHDVLFNITGASIGRVTTAPAEMAGARVNQHVCILRTTEVLLPRFLAYYLATPQQQALVNSNQTGGTRQAVTKGLLLNWSVPLPPVSEQRRIVELLEHADLLRHQCAEADQLADRILPALFHEMFGEPVTNSKNLPTQKLENLAQLQRGDFRHRPRSDQRFYGGQYPFIQINDITASRLLIKSHSQTLNEEGLAISRMFPAGTVVISIAATIAASGILTFDSCFPDSLVGVRSKCFGSA